MSRDAPDIIQVKHCIDDIGHCFICPRRAIYANFVHAVLNFIAQRADNVRLVVEERILYVARLAIPMECFLKGIEIFPLFVFFVLDLLGLVNQVLLDGIVQRTKLLIDGS